MRGWSIWALITIGVVIIMVTIALASAQDRGAWFKSLKQPGTAVSCCDIGDCLQVEATWQGGGWWVRHSSGRLVPVPPEVVLTKPLSIDGEAYACWLGDSTTLRCFVPPSPPS